MSTPIHGEYRPGMGFYDSGRGGWIKDAAKLTDVTTGRALTQGDRDQVAGWGKRKSFKPNPQIERLLQLRDSDRSEERQTYQRMVAGSMRIQVRDYEARKAEAQEG